MVLDSRAQFREHRSRGRGTWGEGEDEREGEGLHTDHTRTTHGAHIKYGFRQLSRPRETRER